MSEAWSPELRLHTRGEGCQLELVGVTYGNGRTLQEAGNDLLTRLFDLAVGVRVGPSRSGPLDRQVMEFLWEIGELAARGGDLRGRVFGVLRPRLPAE